MLAKWPVFLKQPYRAGSWHLDGDEWELFRELECAVKELDPLCALAPLYRRKYCTRDTATHFA